MPHDASRSRIVISTRCRGRSVARVTRMRSRAGAVKRPRASSSRAARASATTTTRREDDDEDVDERFPPRVARAESFGTRARVISTSECHPPARARERRAGHPFDARVVRRPSVVRRRDASRECREKNGRSSRTSLVGRARSLVRAFARDDVRGNDRARRRVSSASARRFASFFYTCAWIPR